MIKFRRLGLVEYVTLSKVARSLACLAHLVIWPVPRFVSAITSFDWTWRASGI
jgi:hypothetical protein